MVRLKTLLDMLEGDPDDSFLRYALAKEYENMESWPEALSHYLIIKEKDPDYVGMYYHLAKLYEYLQETDKALKTYEEGISIAKKIPDFHALSELNSAKLNLEMEF
ncbi:MAG: tetratricopeptide repeat protein [Saprospiraceae bacterium]|nr:tetratricopeptide repeat protein [Saprospiraceae bacterium]